MPVLLGCRPGQHQQQKPRLQKTSIEIWELESKVEERREDKRQNPKYFTVPFPYMHNAKLLQAAVGDYSEAVAKAPFVIWPLQFSGASERSTAGAGSCTHFNTGLGDHGNTCSRLLLWTCRKTWVQGEGEIQIQLELYKHLPPLPTTRTTIHIHKNTDDALTTETPGVIQADLHECL